jgi:predicted ribosome quality control (RQC) complex YloA/Tae2 family protein
MQYFGISLENLRKSLIIDKVKSLNFREFQSYIMWCENILSGAQLQEVWTNDLLLVMEFYKFRNLWLVVDLDMSHPQIVLLQKQPPPRTKKQKPVGLFISSHGKNLRVKALKSVLQLGRVAELELGSLVEENEKNCLIEIQVVPRAPNVLVTAEGKKLSWFKPQELPRLQDVDTSPPVSGEVEWLDREDQWFAIKRSPGGNSGKSEIKDPSKAIEKKRKALEALQRVVNSSESQDLRSYGDILASQQAIPRSLMQFSKLSINEAFAKAKQLERKREGTLLRIEKILEEIRGLESGELALERPSLSGVKSMKKAEAQGRRLALGSNIEAICGKSAKDNLAILRQARAWDLWLHLKDYPGAHGIIFREKGQNVDLHLLQKVAEWVISESPAARGFTWGGKYDVVVVECRFVRPLKGDTLGRVTYQSPTVYTFASKKK